jgi:ABC-type glutathione transport system ATPase component
MHSGGKRSDSERATVNAGDSTSEILMVRELSKSYGRGGGAFQREAERDRFVAVNKVSFAV